MKILMIDNYDSFVYNLVQYIGELGEELVVYRNDQISLEEIERLSPSAIVISPGPGRPEEAGICVALIRKFAGKIPILGVCLGHQAIGYAFGGEIVSAKKIMHGKVSPIYHSGKSVFSGLPSPLMGARYHSLAIKRETLPSSLELLAWTEDGEVMAVKHMDFYIVGLQFHPESIATQYGKDILRNFLERR
ncbi:aminodeoxychorismate/anthranilate synthase component II [bacterium]|nr:aminodeoxychorismate/anthranilate synthase component II [bacterium]